MRVKKIVEKGEAKKKQQTPAKTFPEIDAFCRSVIHLQEKAQAEQKGKGQPRPARHEAMDQQTNAAIHPHTH
ncbi:MAG: hypothetical protein LUE08_01070 [Akkermansiaceae bacterium]|nr:hypothetical protein [Akkermansiaceae bacterium]